MKKETFRRIMLILLGCAFLLCGVVVFSVQHKYKKNERLYKNASSTFTTPRDTSADPVPGLTDGDVTGSESTGRRKENLELAPIEVDFKALQAINPEVIGWLYCPDTKIDFPVCRAEDNKYYISHNYARESSSFGAIFADTLNRPDWSDSNTILYGHHLTDGTMFATLDKWFNQEWFDEHPTMWILTPEQDYRVELFSSYYIHAADKAYTIFQGPAEEFEEYLQYIKENSNVVRDDVELDPNAKYVMLSTCAYVFSMARSVVHGIMIPLDSAGGVLIP
jgi:sortase B